MVQRRNTQSIFRQLPRPVRCSRSPLARCSTFTKVWDSPVPNGSNSLRAALKRREAGAVLGVTFWRPMPPIGYAVLGHCASRDADQPSFQVRCRRDACVSCVSCPCRPRYAGLCWEGGEPEGPAGPAGSWHPIARVGSLWLAADRRLQVVQ